MSQNDFTIANQGFPAFRADLNSALQALATNSSGGSAPSTTFANMWWYDTSNNIMYIRNEDNDAWIKFAELDQANDKFVLSGTLQLDDGTVSAPALTFNSDTNMGIYRGGTDILKFVTAGTDAITINASQDVTLAGSLNFADNEKAQFGAGSDLQIYHDGVHSRITDAGTGYLSIDTNGSDIRLTSNGVTEFMAKFEQDGPVSLYYDSSTYSDPKLATTATGINVTGTATMDGLTVDGDGTLQSSSGSTLTLKSTVSSAGADQLVGGIDFFNSDTSGDGPQVVGSLRTYTQGSTGYGGYIDIGTSTGLTGSEGADTIKRLQIDADGDISFYEDTGSTPKMVWSASDERLGIGTSSPLAGSTLDVIGQINARDNERISLVPGANVNDPCVIETGGGSPIAFSPEGTEAMRIDTSGRLLVGKTSSSLSTVGVELNQNGTTFFTRSLPSGDGAGAVYMQRNTSDGNVLMFYDSTTSNVGSISTLSSTIAITGQGTASQTSGLAFVKSAVAPRVSPCQAGPTTVDNVIDLGHSSQRFDDIFATNGTIQTSDQQEKNTITDSDLGIDFIKRLTPKSYIFNGKTRTHYGLIAQDVETVLTDINKPTSGFAGFIKDDISEEQDGSQYRYGLRYTEFVAPLIQAVKDQQATIDALTARITALENGE